MLSRPALSRAARDSLWQGLIVAWLLAPLWPHLPAWAQALAPALLLWRAGLAWRARALPSMPWRMALLLLVAAGTYASHGSLWGREAGVTLVALLLCLKTLEGQTRRDALVVFFLGFFVLLTHLFYAQTLLQALHMVVGLLGLLSALILAHLTQGRPSLGFSLRLAARMLLLGTPVMLTLFVLFPRIAPLWGVGAQGAQDAQGRSGLSSHMQVGQVASLALDDSVALRVRFEGAPPPPQFLYFRGPVLTRFDGREWLALEPAGAGEPQAAAEDQAQAWPYEMTLEPSTQPWLLTLDLTIAAPSAPALRAQRDADGVWRAASGAHGLLRYRAVAHAPYRLAPDESPAVLQAALALPPGRNPRTLALARQLEADLRQHGQAPNPALRLNAALAYLAQGRYSYTLEPGVYGEHTADAFWFEQRAGFCEHIASAFAVLLRALQVPARVVTGYQGGEANALDAYWVLRQSDAHAWTEVWLPGQGWLRVDPTAFVAPARVGALRRLAPAPNVWARTLAQVNPGLLRGLRDAWEALNNRWNQTVLNYTQERQLDLLRRLGVANPDWQDLSTLLLVAMALASAGFLWGLAWQAQRSTPWQRQLERAQQRLAKLGHTAAPGQGPRSLACWLAAQPGAGQPAWQTWHDWLLRLDAQRYGSASPAAQARELATLARTYKHLPWPLAAGASDPPAASH